jgi:DNA-binding XRE family transcriptional regulator
VTSTPAALDVTLISNSYPALVRLYCLRVRRLQRYRKEVRNRWAFCALLLKFDDGALKLEQQQSWLTRGSIIECVSVRSPGFVWPEHVPRVNVRKVRTKMGLSQAQFATKFGFPPATLRNWEQGRSRPDVPTRVLLAVIAKHPEAEEDVLREAS